MIICKNKKANFDYELSNHLICWMQLKWYEVKALREKNCSMKWAYISFNNWGSDKLEMRVKNLNIWKYSKLPNHFDHFPEQSRKILAKKSEIEKFFSKWDQPWYTVVPTAILTKWRYIKIEIALWKWKKKFDKRNAIKERDTNRNLAKNLKKLINWG